MSSSKKREVANEILNSLRRASQKGYVLQARRWYTDLIQSPSMMTEWIVDALNEESSYVKMELPDGTDIKLKKYSKKMRESDYFELIEQSKRHAYNGDAYCALVALAYASLLYEPPRKDYNEVFSLLSDVVYNDETINFVREVVMPWTKSWSKPKKRTQTSQE